MQYTYKAWSKLANGTVMEAGVLTIPSNDFYILLIFLDLAPTTPSAYSDAGTAYLPHHLSQSEKNGYNTSIFNSLEILFNSLEILFNSLEMLFNSLEMLFNS